jgi:sulfite reductase (NADPH) hemoprotein beta-component
VADVVGYLPKEKIVEAAEAVLVFQRDHGNRSDRKNARLKYTIDRFGLDYFKTELERTHSIQLEKPKDYQFETLGDKYGWTKSADGFWHYTVFVEGGKLVDKNNYLAFGQFYSYRKSKCSNCKGVGKTENKN